MIYEPCNVRKATNGGYIATYKGREYLFETFKKFSDWLKAEWEPPVL